MLSLVARFRKLNHDTVSLHTRGVIGIVIASGLLAAITANGCHIFLASKGAPDISLLPSVIYGMVKWVWWGGIVLGMWWCSRYRPQLLNFSSKTVLFHIGVGSVLSWIHLALLQMTWTAGLHWTAWRLAYPSINYFSLSSFGADLLIYGFLFGFSGFLYSQSHRQAEKLLKLELERQLSEAQLQALQSQMEPHFLFNTLNAITSLVAHGRNTEAMKTLGHLNTILRMTLQRRAPEKVPFTEELRIIESYLAIQKVRFEERLQIKIETTPEALNGLIPCFLLQPIIENAVQHGIAQRATGGTIETSVRRVGDTLWMQVRDDGDGTENASNEGHGIGMKNIQERLAFFYPGAYDFCAGLRKSGGYEVTIQIPYESVSV